MLEVPSEKNEVPDLMMEDEDILPEAEGSTKRKRDEVARGRRKRWKEDDIRPEKQYSPTVSRRTQNPEGFYSLDWKEVQQEEDKWQAPDKWQRILQIVFRSGGLQMNPVGDGTISSLGTQHQGADVVYLRSRYEKPICGEG